MSKTDWDSEADWIIARLEAMDHARPVVDRARVEQALTEHFQRLDLAPLPVRWLPDAERGFVAAGSAAVRAPWIAAQFAVEYAARLGALRAAEPSSVDQTGFTALRAAEFAAWRASEVTAWRVPASVAWRATASAAGTAAGWITAAYEYGMHSAWPSAVHGAWIAAGRPSWRGFYTGADGAAKSARMFRAWRAAWSAAERGGESTAESSAWRAAEWAVWWAAQRALAKVADDRLEWNRHKLIPPEVARCIHIWFPFLTAYGAGLWLFWVLEREVLAVPRPGLRVVDDQLHCEDGPAVFWPGGARYYFWRGVQVPRKVVLRPQDLAAKEISEEPNAEVRRVMLERRGLAGYLHDLGAACIHRDTTGELYRADMPDDEPLVMVRVLNSTPEPDGSRKAYWLRVPPSMRTAREAVAWTFGLPRKTYRPVVET